MLLLVNLLVMGNGCFELQNRRQLTEIFIVDSAAFFV